jgi:hypothetical protein
MLAGRASVALTSALATIAKRKAHIEMWAFMWDKSDDWR